MWVWGGEESRWECPGGERPKSTLPPRPAATWRRRPELTRSWICTVSTGLDAPGLKMKYPRRIMVSSLWPKAVKPREIRPSSRVWADGEAGSPGSPSGVAAKAGAKNAAESRQAAALGFMREKIASAAPGTRFFRTFAVAMDAALLYTKSRA